MQAPPAHADDAPDPLRRRILAVPLLVGSGAALPAASVAVGAPMSPPDDRLGAALDAELARLVADPRRPLASLSVLVLARGRPVYAGQFGRRRIDAGDPARDLPVTPDTLFRVASISKLVVALGAMRLVEAGRLDLDADVGESLGFVLRHPHHPGVPLTLRLLLSHRAGLSDAGGAYLSAGQTLASRLLPGGAHFGDGRCWGQRRPGRDFEYCNIAYGVIASVMERAAGERFDHLMQRLVLAPLGMAGGFEASGLSSAELAELATLYRKAPSDEGPWNPAGPWFAQVDDLLGRRPGPPPGLDNYVLGSNGSLFGPQGRLRTRIQDLGAVAAMLLAAGRHGGQVFLRPASVRTLCSEQWRFDPQHPNGDTDRGEFQAWGVGLQRFIDRRLDTAQGPQGDRMRAAGGQQAWGHLGFAYGLVAGLMVDPSSGSGIVYAIGGTGADPARHRGAHSSFPAWEERLQELLWERAVGARG